MTTTQLPAQPQTNSTWCHHCLYCLPPPPPCYTHSPHRFHLCRQNTMYLIYSCAAQFVYCDRVSSSPLLHKYMTTCVHLWQANNLYSSCGHDRISRLPYIFIDIHSVGVKWYYRVLRVTCDIQGFVENKEPIKPAPLYITTLKLKTLYYEAHHSTQETVKTVLNYL